MDKKHLVNSLKNAGFSKDIITSFEKIRREDFIPESFIDYSYIDEALPIGESQTISQPYTVAFMLKLLELENLEEGKILEIGSGSGYVLALISEICKNPEIIGIERLKGLAEKSRKILKDYENIRVIYGNGLRLIKNLGKFDRILVSAASDEIPEDFIEHLEEEGILIIPVKNSIFQVKKIKKGIVKKEFPGFVFVPLINS